jgi:hypothetical protein
LHQVQTLTLWLYFTSGSSIESRVPFNYRHFEDDMNPGVYDERGFQWLDRIINIVNPRQSSFPEYVLMGYHLSVLGMASTPSWISMPLQEVSQIPSSILKVAHVQLLILFRSKHRLALRQVAGYIEYAEDSI